MFTEYIFVGEATNELQLMRWAGNSVLIDQTNKVADSSPMLLFDMLCWAGALVRPLFEIIIRWFASPKDWLGYKEIDNTELLE